MTPPVPEDSGSTSPLTSALPSAEELYSQNVLVTVNREDLFRLCWTLDGPLDTAISVMTNPYYDPGEPESARVPYARAAPDGGDPTLHPISGASVSNPPVSSMIISVSELQMWPDAWMDVHEGHSLPGSDPDWQWGPAPPHAPAVAREWDKLHLLRCCGEERPWDKDEACLTVRASADFVTIHDFVAQVHPWLMGMRQDLVDAAAYGWNHCGEPLPPDTRFMVFPYPNTISVLPEDEWAEECSERMVAPLIVPYPQPLPGQWPFDGTS